MRIKVEFTDGGSVDATVTPRVEVEWEKHFGKAFGATFAAGAQRTEWYYLAWLAVKHTTETPVKPFEGFIDQLASVTLDVESEGPKAETQ